MRPHTRHPLVSLLVPVFLLACGESNPTAPPADDQDDDHEETLTAELVLSSEHVHILSELTFTVTVRDDHGNLVTDLDAVTVERLFHGTDTWRGTELALVGSSWEGTYTFVSSGEYDIRVSVLRPGQTTAEIVYTMEEHLEAARAHAEVAGMRVEFETFPGHLHEGDEVTATFWIMETERNAEGVRPPLSGLHAEVVCLEANGFEEEHHAEEAEAGVYSATHHASSAGEFIMKIRIGEHEGEISEAAFTHHIAHQH